MQKESLIDFSKLTAIKIGPKSLVTILKDDFSKLNEFYIIGGGNNILVDDNHPKLAMLDKCYDYIRRVDNTLIIGGATKTSKVLHFCKNSNIGGLEFLNRLPATIGGAVYMNAGLKEWEIFNYIDSIKFSNCVKSKEKIIYSYRETNISDVVLEVSINIKDGFDENLIDKFSKMRSNQPKQPNLGSCFANPKNDFAGRLIEAVKLKGFKKGSVSFSPIHANFLVNLGGGVFKDAIWLICEAERRVYEEFGIKLRRENKIVSNNLYKKGFE